MFVMKIPNLSLKHTYCVGQCLRWEELGENGDKGYVVISGERIMHVSQSRSFQTKDNIQFGCSEEEFFSYWYKYFDVGVDYNDYIYSADKKDEYLRKCVQSSGGARFINQGLWEALLESVLADGLNINGARCKVKQFCSEMTKEKKKAIGSVPFAWHPTPRPEEVVKRWEELEEQKGTNIFLKDESNKKAYHLALSVVHGDIDLRQLISQPDERETVIDELSEQFGLSRQGRSRIGLYAFRNRDTFPICETMKGLLEENYGSTWRDSLERCKSYRGIMLQFMYVDEIVYGERRKQKWGF